MTTAQDLTEATQELCRKMTEWRQSGPSPRRIPSELWMGAVDLARCQGIYKTARALRVDYNALKRRMSGDFSARQETTAAFVELLSPLAPVPSAVTECEMEVEAPRGGRLRLRMRGMSAADLASIVRDFAR